MGDGRVLPLARTALVGVVAVAAVACSGGPDFGAARVVIRGSSGPVAVRAALAATEAARERGLMGLSAVPADGGMVFLFSGPTTRGFWMKDTKVALSAAFWDRSDRIVAILDMVPCRGDPCPVYWPRHAYVGALEVNMGFFARHAVHVGNTVEITRKG